VFGPGNLKATLILGLFTSLCQQTGSNVFNMFSIRIITQINEHVTPEYKVPANLSTQLIGVFAPLSVIASFFVMGRFGFKLVLEYGYCSMAIDLFLMVIAIKMNNGILALIAMLLFQIFFYTSVAPIHWFYLPEVLNDC